jgi:hypothetical protein
MDKKLWLSTAAFSKSNKVCNSESPLMRAIDWCLSPRESGPKVLEALQNREHGDNNPFDFDILLSVTDAIPADQISAEIFDNLNWY